MKILKVLLAIIAALVLAVLVFAMTLPSDISIEREIKINAPQTYTFDYLYDMKNWEDWTVWKDFDSTLTYSYKGKTEGVGAIQIWNGEHSQKASLEITNIVPNEKIEFQLSWDNDETSFSGYITTKQMKDGETRVVWVHYKDVGWNPFMRILGSMLENVMGPNFEQSLQKLKKKVELQYNIETKTVNIS